MQRMVLAQSLIRRWLVRKRYDAIRTPLALVCLGFVCVCVRVIFVCAYLYPCVRVCVRKHLNLKPPFAAKEERRVVTMRNRVYRRIFLHERKYIEHLSLVGEVRAPLSEWEFVRSVSVFYF